MQSLGFYCIQLPTVYTFNMLGLLGYVQKRAKKQEANFGGNTAVNSVLVTS